MEQACVQYLINVRHNGKMDFPHCENEKVYAFKDGKTFKCAECKKRLKQRVQNLIAFLKVNISEIKKK